MQKNDSNNRMQFQFVAVLDDSVREAEKGNGILMKKFL